MALEQITLSDEQVQDIVASLITSGSGSDVVYNDTNDTLTVSLSDSISVNTLEADDGTFNSSITDPTGTTHSTELAEISDIPKLEAITSTNNNVTVFSTFNTGTVFNKTDPVNVIGGIINSDDSGIITVTFDDGSTFSTGGGLNFDDSGGDELRLGVIPPMNNVTKFDTARTGVTLYTLE